MSAIAAPPPKKVNRLVGLPPCLRMPLMGSLRDMHEPLLAGPPSEIVPVKIMPETSWNT